MTEIPPGGDPQERELENSLERHRRGEDAEWARDLLSELAMAKNYEDAHWLTMKVTKGMMDRGARFTSDRLEETLDTLATKLEPKIKLEIALHRKKISSSEEFVKPAGEREEYYEGLGYLKDVAENAAKLIGFFERFDGNKPSLDALASLLSAAPSLTPEVFKTIYRLDGFSGPKGNRKVGRMINMIEMALLRMSVNRDKQMLDRIRSGKGYQTFMFPTVKEDEAWIREVEEKIYNESFREEPYLPNIYAESITEEEKKGIEDSIKELVMKKLGVEVEDDLFKLEYDIAEEFADMLFRIKGHSAFYGVDKDVDENGKIASKVICEGFPSSDATIEAYNPRDKVRDKSRQKDLYGAITQPDDFPQHLAVDFLRRITTTDVTALNKNENDSEDVRAAKRQLAQRSFWELWMDGNAEGKVLSLGDMPWDEIARESYRNYWLRIFMVGRKGNEPRDAGVLHYYTGTHWLRGTIEMANAGTWAEMRRFFRYTLGAPVVTEGEYARWFEEKGGSLWEDWNRTNSGVAPKDKLSKESEDLQTYAKETVFGLMHRWFGGEIKEEGWKKVIGEALAQARFFGEGKEINSVNNLSKRARVKNIQQRKTAY